MPEIKLSNIDRAFIATAGAGTEQAVKKIQESVEKGLGQIAAAQEEQARIADAQARRQQVEADSFREAPQRLWRALKDKDSVFAGCDAVLGSLDGLSSDEASATAETLMQYRPYFHDVLGVNPTYLPDFQQKDQLYNLQMDCVRMAAKINARLPVLGQAMAEKALSETCDPYIHLTPSQAESFIRDYRQEDVRRRELLSNKDTLKNIAAILLIVGGIITGIGYLLFPDGGSSLGLIDSFTSFPWGVMSLLSLLSGCALVTGGIIYIVLFDRCRQELEKRGTLFRTKWGKLLPAEKWNDAVYWLGVMKWVRGGWEIPSDVVTENAKDFTQHLRFPER